MATCAQMFASFCWPRSWVDRREADQKLVNDRIKLGSVTHISSGDEFGKIFPSDSNATLRKKMAQLFFGVFPIAPIRGILRAGLIVSCHWAWGQAVPETLKQWRAERRIAALDDPLKAPGRVNLYTRIALQAIYRLTEAFVKLITLPVATLLCAFSALVAAFDPLLSRLVFARVEEIWSVDLGEWNSMDQLVNYLAPCMLPTRVGERINIYRAFLDYKEETLRSRAYSLERVLKENRQYLPNDSAPLLQLVKNLRSHMKQFSLSDPDEIDQLKNKTIPAEKIKEIERKRQFLLDLRNQILDYVQKADASADGLINSELNAEQTEKEVQELLAKLQTQFQELNKWVS